MIGLEEYQDWKRDTRNNRYRILAVELDYFGGTITLGSQPWMSDTLVSFDDWMFNPEMVAVLNGLPGVGDLEAVCLDTNVDWGKLKFRGYQSRWYYGDTRWPLEKFLRIATVVNAGCRKLNGQLYKFNFFDSSKELSRTFIEEETTQSLTARQMIDYVVETSGLDSVTLHGIDSEVLNYHLTMTFSIDTTIKSALLTVAQSIGANLRVSQTGSVELVAETSFNVSDVLVTPDDIVARSVNQIDLIPAYKWINVGFSDTDRAPIRRRTSARTGSLEEEYTVRTAIDNGADAVSFADRVRNYRELEHPVWELQTLDVTGLLHIGNKIESIHQDYSGYGFIRQVTRSPTTVFSYIEIIT